MSSPPDSKKKTLFIICPLKEPGSETRRRSDQVKTYIIDEVANALGYETLRSDEISVPGKIETQIIEHLIEDDLVIADLSDQNPNVFYELAVRQATGKPVILMSLVGQKTPFDVYTQRIIPYDHADLDRVHQAKADLHTMIKSIEDDNFTYDSPIKMVIPLEKGEETRDPGYLEIINGLRNLSSRLSSIEGELERRTAFRPDTGLAYPLYTEHDLMRPDFGSDYDAFRTAWGTYDVARRDKTLREYLQKILKEKEKDGKEKNDKNTK